MTRGSWGVYLPWLLSLTGFGSGTFSACHNSSSSPGAIPQLQPLPCYHGHYPRKLPQLHTFAVFEEIGYFNFGVLGSGLSILSLCYHCLKISRSFSISGLSEILWIVQLKSAPFCRDRVKD